MRVPKIFIINAFIFGWLLSACALAQGPITVRSTDPVVSVRLQANPSTGYQWVLVQYNDALMDKPGNTYEPSPDSLAGAPGYSVWRFKFKPSAFAVSQKTTVILEYKRPWENTAVKSESIQIIIEPNQ